MPDFNQLDAHARVAVCLMRMMNGSMATKLTPDQQPDKNAIMGECYSCTHRREVPGNCHIECVEPDAYMTGDPHGIREGWFMYPLLFDPTWKTKRCAKYVARPESTVSPAISPAVSHAK